MVAEKKIPVAEIFASISGEAGGLFQMGSRCVFLRLSGCNLSCVWCDTEETKSSSFGKRRTADAIAISVYKEMIKYSTNNLVITGGEPLLYDDAVLHIIRDLRCKFNFNVNVQIETNGTLDWKAWYEFGTSVGLVVDYKPKSAGLVDYKACAELFASLRLFDVVKIVVMDTDDLAEAIDVIQSDLISNEAYICLSVTEEMATMAYEALCMTNRLRTGISVQLHKMLKLA